MNGTLNTHEDDSRLESTGVVHFVKDRREPVINKIRQLWADEKGQDVAEYAVMLAVILVIVIGTVRLIGSNANTVFSQVGSSLAQ
ncbi:MAG: Flp family type IVb pilin [Bryobacteraceae bacterium]